MLLSETPLLSQLFHCQHCGRLGHSRLRDGHRVPLQGFIRVADLQSLTYAAEKGCQHRRRGDCGAAGGAASYADSPWLVTGLNAKPFCPGRARNRLNGGPCTCRATSLLKRVLWHAGRAAGSEAHALPAWRCLPYHQGCQEEVCTLPFMLVPLMNASSELICSRCQESSQHLQRRPAHPVWACCPAFAKMNQDHSGMASYCAGLPRSASWPTTGGW